MFFITQRIRELRNNPTKAEKSLWLKLRNKQLGKKFRRQYPIIFFEGPKKMFFIADLICLEKKLIIEVDGKAHQDQKEYDQARSLILGRMEYKIVRFTNEEIYSGLDEVVRKIKILL